MTSHTHQEMTTDRMEPCPHCGYSATPHEFYHNSTKHFHAHSHQCIRCGFTTETTASWPLAVEMWNRRSKESRLSPPSAAGTTPTQDLVDFANDVLGTHDVGTLEYRLAEFVWNSRALTPKAASSQATGATREVVLEEAAATADELHRDAEVARTEDRREMGRDWDPNSYGAGYQAGEISAADTISKAIRALASPAPVVKGEDK